MSHDNLYGAAVEDESGVLSDLDLSLLKPEIGDSDDYDPDSAELEPIADRKAAPLHLSREINHRELDLPPVRED